MTNKNIKQNGGGFLWDSLEEKLQKAKDAKTKVDADVSADQSKKDAAQKAVDDAQKAVDDEKAAASQSAPAPAPAPAQAPTQESGAPTKPWYKFWGSGRRKSSKKSKKAKSMKGGRRRKNKSNKSKK